MRTQKDIFKEEGFSVLDPKNESPLLDYIKENHPGIIKDNEVDLEELKTVLGLPIDEKVNGYGLNFVGRNVARSKYASETEKELKVNKKLSKNFNSTQNMVLKGDNLDTLKILKAHYTNKIIRLSVFISTRRTIPQATNLSIRIGLIKRKLRF